MMESRTGSETGDAVQQTDDSHYRENANADDKITVHRLPLRST